MVRLAVVFAVPISVIAPALLGLFLEVQDWSDFEHPLNPIYVLARFERLKSPGGETTVLVACFGLAAVAALSLLLNAPRAIVGIREVLRASAARGSKRADPAS